MYNVYTFTEFFSSSRYRYTYIIIRGEKQGDNRDVSFSLQKS